MFAAILRTIIDVNFQFTLPFGHHVLANDSLIVSLPLSIVILALSWASGKALSA